MSNSEQMDASRIKVLIAASEIKPFAKVGGLADVTGSLPLTLQKMGLDVRLMLPAYRAVKEAEFDLEPIFAPFDIPLGKSVKTISLLELRDYVLPVYLVDCPEYYDIADIYGAYVSGGLDENLARFCLFCKAVMETFPKIEWYPNIIHAHDWQTSLLPAYIKQSRNITPTLSSTGSLLTIHNLAYQGTFPTENYELLGVEEHIFPWNEIEFYGKLNLLKMGIFSADRLNTVSQSYREETLQGGEPGAGLEEALRRRAEQYTGILNGIDYQEWSPETDQYLPYKFSGNWDTFKCANKNALLRLSGFSEYNTEAPVIGIIARLVHQKGLDVLIDTLEEILERRCYVLTLGSGEQVFKEGLMQIRNKYPSRIRLDFTYNEPLAHRIFAGADMFLMPSRFEPCGLTQMIAMHYGTIPIVHDVGGLKNTVKDFDPTTEEGSGFKFLGLNKENILSTLDRALIAFSRKELWRKIRYNAVKENFSWESSATKYIDLYREIICQPKS